MRDTFRSRGLSRFVWCCWVVAAVSAEASPSWAQTAIVGTVEYTSESYSVTVPTTCPTNLRGGFTGWVFGIPYAGYRWMADWNRVQVLEPVNYSKARYHPAAYDGYASLKGDYIESEWTASARWYEPEIDNQCTAEDHYFAGRWIGRDESYIPYAYHGRVEECTGGSGGGRTSTKLISDDGYDIYDPGYYGSESCTESPTGESGGGGSGGSGTQYSPGDSTGGETVDWGTGVGNGGSSACGATALVEYVCIDIMTDTGWSEWGCGYVTSC